MKNFKSIFFSSFITLLIVSVIFAYFYYNKTESKENVENSSIISGSTQTDIDKSSVVPVNLRNQINNAISLGRESIITNTVKKISPSIVGINVTEKRYVRDFFYRIYEQQIPGLGSGAIISPDGYIITNDHVAGSASQIVVTMTDGTEYPAKLVGTDKSSDIALLKIEANNLPYLSFGNSDDILIGEWVIALGNPFGLFKVNDKPTVTVGVVSSLGMNLGVIEDRYYLNMIQTDAAINSGNSGGPLVNGVGEMIGMNTIIWTQGAGNVGVGFAIPINKIKSIIAELKENGSVNRNFWTGISIHTIDQGIARYYNLSNTYGVIVTKIERNSPGSKSGLTVGDVILEINEIKIKDEETMIYILHQARTNDTLKLRVLRDNNPLTINLKLESRYD